MNNHFGCLSILQAPLSEYSIYTKICNRYGTEIQKNIQKFIEKALLSDDKISYNINTHLHITKTNFTQIFLINENEDVFTYLSSKDIQILRQITISNLSTKKSELMHECADKRENIEQFLSTQANKNKN